jgi:phospholipid/cholesterol/gamma-HCH transport system substrate-binding protein
VTIARAAAIGSLVAAVVAVAVLMFGGGGGHEYKIMFQNAGQLVKGNQVQVGGKVVGKIKKIELTEDNQAEVTVNVDEPFAPLHDGTTAVIRVQSLPSIANRNISLTPGPNNAPKIPDGGIVETDKTTAPVDLDVLFDTLDPKTRKNLQNVLKGFANWYVGQGQNLNKTFRHFGPALSSTAAVMRELSADQQVFERFIVDASRLVTALADRRDDVSGFVHNTQQVFGAIGDENEQFSRALKFLPGTLQKANASFVNLRGALTELDELTNVTKPIASDLAPFFKRLNTLVKKSTPAFHDFALLFRNKGSSNDLIDLLRDLPQLEKVTRTSFKNGVTSLQKGLPVIQFIRPYAADFASFLSEFGGVFGYYDANGHYLRVQAQFNAFSFSENGGNGQLSPLTPAQRKNVISNRGAERRCPGAATQPAADGSNPFTDDGKLGPADCDPSLRPPGP